MTNNNPEPKSSWGYISIAFVIIFCGLYWLIQQRSTPPIPPMSAVPAPRTSPITTELEAAAASITIEDYSDEL